MLACRRLRNACRSNSNPNNIALAFMRSRCSSSRRIPAIGSKRIVSIRSNPVPSTLANSPLAKHSAHSSASLESATTPEPSPSESVFVESHRVKVRMATLKAASPLASIRPMEPQYTPRGAVSTSSTTCIARIFGAPVIDPHGNNAVMTSTAFTPSLSTPVTVEVIW